MTDGWAEELFGSRGGRPILGAEARRSEERTARLDAIYGSAVAAQGRSQAQESDPSTGSEVADLQARRDVAQEGAAAAGD